MHPVADDPLLRPALLGRVLRHVTTAACCLALTLAVTVGAHGRLSAAEARRAATLHPATAVTETAAPLAPGSRVRVPVPVPALVRAPRGVIREIRVPVTEGAPAGVAVRVWLTSDGRTADPPLEPAAITLQALLWGAAAIGGVAAAGRRLLRGLSDRRRARSWAAEWEEMEPRWSRR